MHHFHAADDAALIRPTSSDTELKLQGIQALTIALGEVQAKRFISLILKEPTQITDMLLI